MKYTHNQKSVSRSFSSRAGFTLVETMIVAAAIVLFMGLIIGIAPIAMRKINCSAEAGQMAHLKTATTSFITQERSFGRTPLTEDTAGVPAAAAAGTQAVVSKAATLDDVFVREGLLDKPLRSPISSAVAPTGTNPLIWDVTAQQFKTTNGSATDFDYSNSVHTRCIITTGTSTMATPAPGTSPSTDGKNFRLDGVNGLLANSRIVVRVVPNVQLKTAQALSSKIDGDALSETDATTTDDRGAVVYRVTAGSDTTTVYEYITTM
jgi:type II secretory pathway pseudopilin PulG